MATNGAGDSENSVEEFNEKENLELNVLEDAEFVAKNSRHVTLVEENLGHATEIIVEKLRSGDLNDSDWLAQELHPKTKDDKAVNWVFLADVLNFSFWTEPDDKYIVEYAGKEWTGYFAGCACINRAVDAGKPMIDPEYYSKLGIEELSEVFRGKNGKVIPLLEERARVMKEEGEILIKKFDGSFMNCVKEAQGSALKLLEIILDFYCNLTVYILKRAQILVADVWRCLGSEGLAAFADIDQITIFADYRIPQVLAYVGVLKYSDELMDKLKRKELLENGSEMEVEIRALTIHACHVLTEDVKTKCGEGGQKLIERIPDLYASLNSVVIDNFLWCYRRAHAEAVEAAVPFHRTRSIFY